MKIDVTLQVPDALIEHLRDTYDASDDSIKSIFESYVEDRTCQNSFTYHQVEDFNIWESFRQDDIADIIKNNY